MAEAAEVLGISAEAVRGRIRRGTLPVERESGTVYVLLENDARHRTTADQPTDRTVLLITEMQDRIQALEEANRENRRIIAALTQRIPAIEAPSQEASSEPPEPPTTATEQPGRVEPRRRSRGHRSAQSVPRGIGGGLVPESRQDKERREFLDRSFEFFKHMATLGTAAGLLILAIYREQEEFPPVMLALILLTLGLCVVVSVYGMQQIAVETRRPVRYNPDPSGETHDTLTAWLAIAAGDFFMAAVVGFALHFLTPRPWPVLPQFLALVVVLVLLLIYQARNTRGTRSTPRPKDERRQNRPQAEVEDAQEASERRSWWREFFGFR